MGILVLLPGLCSQAQGGEGGHGRRGGFGGQAVQGIVTAASGSKVTIKTEAGDSYEITAADNARIMRDRQPISLGDIKPGDSVTALGQVDAAKKTVEARMVMDVDAATVAKARENLGKTYITGRITAIDADNLKLTVMRPDNVSQVIAVDEGTSFQRGDRGVAQDVIAAGGLPGFGGGMQGRGQQGAPPAPESITLADIKVGDVVMATGTIKNGVFTALKMGVSGGMGGGRRREGAGQGTPGASATPPPGAPPATPPQ